MSSWLPRWARPTAARERWEVLLRLRGPMLAVGALGCLAGQGRAPAADGQVVVRDSAGIKIVENRGDGLWGGSEGVRLSDRPVVEVGAKMEDAGTTLYRVTGGFRLSDGRLVVVNGGTSELLFFSSSGRLATRAGGLGGGPGEFTSVMGLGTPIHMARDQHDTVRAFDQFGGKMLVFSPGGEFVRSAVLYEGEDHRAVNLATGVGWFGDGTFLATNTSRQENGAHEGGVEAGMIRPWLVLRRFGHDGRVIDTIGIFPGDQKYVRAAGNLDRSGTGTLSVGLSPVPFAHGFRASSRGATLAVGITDRAEILLFDSDGGLTHIVRGPEAPRAVTAADREAWIATHGGTVPAAPFPDRMPAFRDLLLDGEGRLWAEEYSQSGDESLGPIWRVYSNEGRFLGRVTLPVRLEPLDIGRDYLLGVWRDDLDVEYVQLFTVVSSGGHN